MAIYHIEMTEECGGSQEIMVDAVDLDEARARAEKRLERWVQDGEYGDEGASVSARCTIRDETGEVLDEIHTHVEIEPDHDALIRAAGGDLTCEHDWTREGEGGCTENPGVWSVGGTALVFASHCRKCGLHRRERTIGSYCNNPGKHDTVTYHQPDSWCPDCEHEECECEED
jgi:hypothetical protein